MIANNGSMPFDGWAYVFLSVWGMGTSALQSANAYINDNRVVGVTTQASGSGNNAAIFVPVKQGDIYTVVLEGSNRSARCTLYPYEAAPVEEES